MIQKQKEEQSNSVHQQNDFGVKTGSLKVADINFSFRNRHVLDLLKQRGEAILDNDEDLQRKLEKYIQKLIRNNHEKLNNPVTAFITFETEEGYLKATSLNKKRIGFTDIYKAYWQGYPMFFKHAREPDVIQWENYYVPKREKCLKLSLILSVLMLILVSAFMFFFYCQQVIYIYMNVYPHVD